MIKHALLELPEDKRDFNLGSLVPKKTDVPLVDFSVGSAEIEDQGETMLCTMFSSTKACEFMDSIRRTPFYNALKAQQGGANIFQNGTDLRTALKTFLDFGALSVQTAPPDINSMVNWENLPSKFDVIASNLAEKSFLSVSGYNDTFSSIQAFLWANKRPVITGMLWRESWLNNAAIPTSYENTGSGHAFIWIGQKIINGVPFLTAQLSNGTAIGDNGLFYFPAEVVNKECMFGNFAFVDYNKNILKILHNHGWSLRMVWLAEIFNKLNLQ